MRARICLKIIAISLVFGLCSCGVPQNDGVQSSQESSSAHAQAAPSAQRDAEAKPEAEAASEAGVDGSVREEHNPFDPYVQLVIPESEVLPFENSGPLSGTWHHYLNPVYTDMANATYQYIFSNETISMSLGTYQSDSGVFFHGNYTLSDNGAICAELTYSSPEALLGQGDAEKMAVNVLVERAQSSSDILLFTVTDIAGGNSQFNYAFSPIVGYRMPFVSYSG